MASKCTVWKVLEAAAKYDGSETAHKDVVSNLVSHGQKATMNDEWCTQAIMSILYDAGGIDLVGGYARLSKDLKKNAEKKGIWKSGSSDILPGDIVVYGTKDGTPNHTELAIGSNVNLCGNYKQISKDTCQRRKRNGRTVIGRVRPKYAAMDTMDNLQYTIAAVDCMLGVYGSGDTRKKQLSVFGTENCGLIQKEIDRVWDRKGLVIRDMAVYVIAGRAGKGAYRKARLGSWATEVQGEVDDIHALSGKKVNKAAEDVMSGIYGTGAVRVLLLSFCGYDATAVQARVNAIIDEKNGAGVWHPRIRVWGIWFFEGNESLYGDSTALIQYGQDDKTIEHVILIDTGMKAGKTVQKLKAAGVETIDAVVISHAHSDHYGALTDVFENFTVKALYLPDTAELDKYQKSYGDSIRRQEKKAKKHGALCTYLTTGACFTVGRIRCDCVWQGTAADFSEHDDHHYVNNLSLVTRFTLDDMVVFHSAGDLQNEGNNVLVRQVEDLRADIFKCQWHGDANACNATICAAVRPSIAICDYHHTERSGRGTTRKRLEAVGAVMARNAENGDIYIDCTNGVMELSCSKGNLYKKISA